MTKSNYSPGGDAKVISEVAKAHFGGSYERMFDHHGWTLEAGQQYMHQAPPRIVDTYGSIRAFQIHFQNLNTGRSSAKPFWTDDTSVLLTSLWGWLPEEWGTIGWTGERGRTRRMNLLRELSDPFICVCYVTSNRTETDPDLKGMIGGFYLVTHQTGDRNDFSHPIHHDNNPTQWQHSLRAIRAFSYLPEYRLPAMEVFPSLSRNARHVASMGEIITDPEKINMLRDIPWIEVPVYSEHAHNTHGAQYNFPQHGMVQAGPTNSGGYFVPESPNELSRELYILRLDGDAAAYMGRSVEGMAIYKIGLSVSPDLRRQAFQKSMPRGSFRWELFKTTRNDGDLPYSGFSSAVVGESAMKRHLARHAEWLGNEFYLAHEVEIETAWNIGRSAALRFEHEGLSNAD